MSKREGKVALNKCKMLGLSMIVEYDVTVYALTSFQTLQ